MTKRFNHLERYVKDRQDPYHPCQAEEEGCQFCGGALIFQYRSNATTFNLEENATCSECGSEHRQQTYSLN
jgi:hypothetical protein